MYLLTIFEQSDPKKIKKRITLTILSNSTYMWRGVRVFTQQRGGAWPPVYLDSKCHPMGETRSCYRVSYYYLLIFCLMWMLNNVWHTFPDAADIQKIFLSLLLLDKVCWGTSAMVRCVYDLISADVCLQMGWTTAEKSKSIMWIQITVNVRVTI